MPESTTIQYRVTGMDCPSCAAKIRHAVETISGVSQVKVSIASQLMTLEVDEPEVQLPEIERAVNSLGYHLARGEKQEALRESEGTANVTTHLTAAYRRALWVVMLLNIGYGLIEGIGGFIAGSQALKADALDFLGDGSITFLGLLAISWSLAWRARAALLQGAFLGVLGISVLVNTIYRVVVLQMPEPELMGGLGLVALVVNVAAALVLMKHRSGDANVRAVWLFSRNDALGNAAVVMAAGLVAWTQTAWPDLAVAVIIAGLFLHSSWEIVIDARSDLAPRTSNSMTPQ